MSVHRDTLVSLVKQYGWTSGVELGVDKGILFGMLLRECPDLHLVGVDLFPDQERSRRVPELVIKFTGRGSTLWMSTQQASALVPDQSKDFVFIDADHSEAAVLDDIACWRSKVRPGGWLGGHDYSPKFPGVIKAVDRIFGSRVQQWPGTIWGVWC